LAVLAAIPAARVIAFRREVRRLPHWNIALWIAGIVLMCIGLVGLGRVINAALPTTILGGYPRPHGWLRLVDLTFGLVLVAFSEEIIFRRCARHMLRPDLGDGHILVLPTSLLLRLSLVDRLRKHDRRFHHGHAFHAFLSAIRDPMARDFGALSRRSLLSSVSARATVS
jgi:uncharacterized membrane protein YbhN (UPF0104 family)